MTSQYIYNIIRNMKTIAITIEESVLERVDRLVSAKRGRRRNRSAIVRQAVDEYILRLEREAEEDRERLIYRRHRGQLRREAVGLIRQQARV